MADADIVIGDNQVTIKNGRLEAEDLLKAAGKLLAEVGAEFEGTVILRDGILIYEGDDNYPAWQLDNGSPPNIINHGGGDINMCNGDILYNDSNGNSQGLINEVKNCGLK